MTQKNKEEDRNRFVGPNGEFVSTFEKKDGHVSIGYLEELMEWIYFHDNKTDDEKMEQIIAMENLVEELLNGREGEKPPLGLKVNYVRTWSERLKKDKDETE